MKVINKYIVSAALLGSVLTAQAQQAPVSVKNNDLKQRGEYVYIDATISVQCDLVESNNSLTLTPVIETNQHNESLAPILINGKKRQKVYMREKTLHNLKEGEQPFAIIEASKTPVAVISYVTKVKYEPWMKDARFVLAQNLCGCGKEEPVGPIVIADKIRMYPTERYQMQPSLAYISPEAETEKHRAEVGTAYLDFEVGKSQILPNFRNNAAELEKIDKTIKTVVDDKNVTPKGIDLTGYASPEGSYKSNAVLSENRVKALREYIRTRHDFKPSFFTLDNVPEDWAGFKAKVEADMNVPARSEVLAIIDSNDDPDKKEAKLRALQGGTAFRYVLKEIFPSLRRSEYKIDYTVREFTVEEGREIIKTRPQQLSLSEMFAVANSYKIGSEDYNNVFDIAVRMFNTDPVANLNAANIALSKGDYTAARKYLEKAGNSPEAINARGVLDMMEGNLDSAESLFKQAQKEGVSAASENLKEIQKKRENNELFDSFNL